MYITTTVKHKKKAMEWKGGQLEMERNFDLLGRHEERWDLRRHRAQELRDTIAYLED